MKDPFLFFGPDYANAWFKLMVDYPADTFIFPPGGIPIGPLYKGGYLRAVNGQWVEATWTKPTGVPIYKYYGETEETYSALPFTVFPWVHVILFSFVAVFAWPVLIGQVNTDDKGYRTMFLVVAWFLSCLYAWFYRVDPVRGAKVSAAVIVASEISKQHSQNASADARAEQAKYNGRVIAWQQERVQQVKEQVLQQQQAQYDQFHQFVPNDPNRPR